MAIAIIPWDNTVPQIRKYHLKNNYEERFWYKVGDYRGGNGYSYKVKPGQTTVFVVNGDAEFVFPYEFTEEDMIKFITMCEIGYKFGFEHATNIERNKIKNILGLEPFRSPEYSKTEMSFTEI